MTQNRKAPAPPAGCRLYTLPEVGAMTGYSISHLRREIRFGKLAVHRVGRTIRISELDLKTFLQNCRSTGPVEKPNKINTRKMTYKRGHTNS